MIHGILSGCNTIAESDPHCNTDVTPLCNNFCNKIMDK